MADKKSTKECFKAFRKDVKYFYDVLEEKSFNLNETLNDEKDYLNVTMSHFKESMAEMNALYERCRPLKFRDDLCLKECEFLSSKFAKNALTVFQLMLVVERYESNKDNPKTLDQKDEVAL